MLLSKKDKKNLMNSVLKLAHLFNYQIVDSYILDRRNAIIVINSDEPVGYIMIHEKLMRGKLEEINRWPMDYYCFGFSIDDVVVPNLPLFKVQNSNGGFGALYNYRNGDFVIPRNTWDELDFGDDNRIIQTDNAVLTSFQLKSDYESGDIICYKDPVTNEYVTHSFVMNDPNYYALVTLDKKIRDNALFKGTNLAKITEIIDLNQYASLEDFKNQRIQELNQMKQERKQKFYQQLQETESFHWDTNTPKILKLGQK